MRRFAAAAMLACTLMLMAPVIVHGEMVDEYSETTHYEDAFSNPLRLAYYLLHPVGFTAEWLIMRPLHYLISRPYLDKFFGYTEIGEEGMSEHLGEHM
jgi:hypothetical protein